MSSTVKNIKALTLKPNNIEVIQTKPRNIITLTSKSRNRIIYQPTQVFQDNVLLYGMPMAPGLAFYMITYNGVRF